MLSLLILLAALSVFLLIYGISVRSKAACACALLMLIVAGLIWWAVFNAPLTGFAV